MFFFCDLMSYGIISQQNCKTICLYMFMAVINVSWWLMVVLHAFVWHGSPFGLSPGGLSAWPRGPGCLPPAACCGGVQLPLGRIQLHRHLTVLRPVLCGSLRSADWDLADRKRVWEGGAGLVVGFLPLVSWDFEVGWGWISLLMVKFMKSPQLPRCFMIFIRHVSQNWGTQNTIGFPVDRQELEGFWPWLTKMVVPQNSFFWYHQHLSTGIYPNLHKNW